MKLWGGRFENGVNSLVNDFNSSIRVDSRMYKEDIKVILCVIISQNTPQQLIKLIKIML